MASTRWLVCEQTGRWAVALRRTLGDYSFRLYETRSLADCQRELALCPASFTFVEVTAANLAQAVVWIERVNREYPAVRVAVVGPRSMQEYAWEVREAGAIAAVFSPRELAPLVRMARRHCLNCPPDELSVQEHVWNRMPWKRWAAANRNRRSAESDPSAPR